MLRSAPTSFAATFSVTSVPGLAASPFDLHPEQLAELERRGQRQVAHADVEVERVGCAAAVDGEIQRRGRRPERRLDLRADQARQERLAEAEHARLHVQAAVAGVQRELVATVLGERGVLRPVIPRLEVDALERPVRLDADRQARLDRELRRHARERPDGVVQVAVERAAAAAARQVAGVEHHLRHDARRVVGRARAVLRERQRRRQVLHEADDVRRVGDRVTRRVERHVEVEVLQVAPGQRPGRQGGVEVRPGRDDGCGADVEEAAEERELARQVAQDHARTPSGERRRRRDAVAQRGLDHPDGRRRRERHARAARRLEADRDLAGSPSTRASMRFTRPNSGSSAVRSASIDAMEHWRRSSPCRRPDRRRSSYRSGSATAVRRSSGRPSGGARAAACSRAGRGR